MSDILQSVSRSFFLTIRALPFEIRETIGLGYLLARASDSIADTSSAALEERKEALTALQRRSISSQAISRLAEFQSDEGERRAILALPTLLEQLAESPDRTRLDWVWNEILKGQLFDLKRFDVSREPLTLRELDDYTYMVAGCVGEFWTLLCNERIPRFSVQDPEVLIADAIRFGKGLQLVNLLRDRRTDARNGRIYVSDEEFPRARRRAEALLHSGVRWVRHVNSGRVRYACIIPLRIGFETLREISADGKPAKISRNAVRRILVQSLPSLWMRRAG